MANQKITELTALTTPTTDDLLAIVDDPAGTPITKKVTLANLIATLFMSNVTVQTLTSASGTYTPTTGMKKALVIAIGPGGAGASVTGTDQTGGGGGGGGTVIRLFTAAEIVGHDGYVVGTPTNNTTFSSSPTLLTAGAGTAGSASADSATLGTQSAGGAGGTATGGDLNIPGQAGGRGIIYDTTNGCGGLGGRSVFGHGGIQNGTEGAGSAGSAYGGGGSGAHCGGGVDRSGGAGANGVIYVIEFLG